MSYQKKCYRNGSPRGGSSPNYCHTDRGIIRNFRQPGESVEKFLQRAGQSGGRKQRFVSEQ